MQALELNKHGKIVFPSNCFPDIDFSTFQTLEQLDAVVRRDFDSKAPTGTEILEKIKTGTYETKFELMRDMALNLFWANRFKITMYDVQPTRWADVPRRRDDLYVPILVPWEDREAKVSAVMSAYPNLPEQWDAEVEDSIFQVLFDVFGHRRNHATKLSPVIPTVADLTSNPRNQTLRLNRYDPDFRRYSYAEIIDCNEDVAELEALRRWSMVLHNQYPWDRGEAALIACRESCATTTTWRCSIRAISRSNIFLSRVAANPAPKTVRSAAPVVHAPVRPYPAIDVRNDLAVQPRIEAISAAHGDLVCTNEDLIRNSAYNWSPMSAEEISAKTGIEQRRYTSDSLEELALRAAVSALAHAQVGPEEIGAVIVCTCTSSRLMPSVATWLSGALGIEQTHALVRPRRRVRRLQLRSVRGDEDPPIGSASGASGLRGEVLRQDRQRPAVADDLRRRGIRRRPGRRTRGFVAGHRVHADVCQRPGEPGQLDPVAQPRVRQQRHCLRSRGEGARRALPVDRCSMTSGPCPTPTASQSRCWPAST